jgi:hypothetical protein
MLATVRYRRPLAAAQAQLPLHGCGRGRATEGRGA